MKIQVIAAITIAFIMVGCQPFFDQDISLEQVNIISPSDSVIIDSGNVWFAWREIPDISFYKITVVSPSFDKSAILVSDSIVGDSITKIQLNLNLGQYQWAISAHNSAYSTLEKISNFSVK